MNAHPITKFVAIAALFLAMGAAVAQEAPRLLPFQGRLTDASGNSFTDGARLIQFQIYDQPTAGQVLWPGEVHRATMNNGLINVVLGTKNPLPTEQSGNPARSFFDQPLYLQITVDANGDQQITTADPPLLPRQAILPVIFAKEAAVAQLANHANHSVNSEKLAGYDWSAILTGGSDPRTGKIDGSRIQPGTFAAASLTPNLKVVLADLYRHHIDDPQYGAIDTNVLRQDLVILRDLAGSAWAEPKFRSYSNYLHSLENGLWLPVPNADYLVLNLGLQLKWIPPGTFQMGSPNNPNDPAAEDRVANEGPVTSVTITRGFWIGKYEVTQQEYQLLVGSNPARFMGDLKRPVEQVSWTDAMSFCTKLSDREKREGRLPAGYEYRLPTEAQWEYACRAGTASRFSYGNDPGYTELGKYAWYSVNSGNTTHAVGAKLANPSGLHDMHGNVIEWCSDVYAGSYPGGSVTDPMGPSSGSTRVHRGGHWGAPGWVSRSAARYEGSPGARYYDTGFRLALVAIP